MKKAAYNIPENVLVFFPFIFSFCASGIAIFAVFFLKMQQVTLDPFLVLLPAVIISAWFGGLRSALFTTVVIAGVMGYFFANTETILNLLLFICSGSLLGSIVEKYKKTDKDTLFRKKEQLLLKEIMHLQTESEKMKHEIKARDEFLSIASHELKTPLTSMVLRIQTALHNIRNVSLANFSVEKLMTMLVDVEEQSKRLTRMINDLLNVSLITTGRLELEKEKVDLSEVVKNVVGRFSERLQKAGVVVKAEKPIIGNVDKLRVEQVVTNLISNALKYGKDKPIEITVEKHLGKGVITVTDHGIGIPKKDTQRIFGRFERAVSSNNYKGLGVGLFISSRIAYAHKGTLKVKSEEGKGSTFTVELPLQK